MKYNAETLSEDFNLEFQHNRSRVTAGVKIESDLKFKQREKFESEQ